MNIASSDDCKPSIASRGCDASLPYNIGTHASDVDDIALMRFPSSDTLMSSIASREFSLPHSIRTHDDDDDDVSGTMPVDDDDGDECTW